MTDMDKKNSRIRRATRTRYKIKDLGKMRLIVHRTPRHIYAQIVTAKDSKTLVSACTLEKSLAKQVASTGNQNASNFIGETIAKRALEKGIQCVAFDRSGFKYHGRIKSLANAARRAGLQF
jgi:large subunit ribosomal protein L18